MNHSSQDKDNTSLLVWLNGELMAGIEASISPESKGLMYGAGCFETMRSDRGRFLHLDRHLDRLKEGIDYLGYEDFADIPGADAIRERINELLKKNRLEYSVAIVRLQASIQGGRGYSRNSNDGIDFLISTVPLEPKNEPVRLHTVDTRVIPSQCRPSHLKLSNTIHYMHAWQEARQVGADDSLMLTLDGIVAETAIANLFWRKNETIYTPSADCDILPGVMREVVIRILSDRTPGTVQEGRYKPVDLKSAESVWITNSVRELLPVGSIDDVTFRTDHPFFDELSVELQKYKDIHLI